MSTVSLNIRLVPRGFAAVSDPRGIPARAVPFVWSESDRLWRSIEPLFVTAAKREGEGAYRAVSELADGPFYHTALRIAGSPDDNAQTLQSRLDTELLQLVAPQRWACVDCKRGLKKEKEAGPCARHQKEMPPAVLYKTTHPRVNRLGQYYVFGWASDYESTTPIAEHNDETWTPSLEAAAAEYEALREASRLAAEQRAQEQSAIDALSPEEKQADFERALFGAGGPACPKCNSIRAWHEESGKCVSCGWSREYEERDAKRLAAEAAATATWAPAPEFTPEQRAAINAFIGGEVVRFLSSEMKTNGDILEVELLQTLYAAFGYEDRINQDFRPSDYRGEKEIPELPSQRPSVDDALIIAAKELVTFADSITCSEYEDFERLYLAFGREQDAEKILRAHAMDSRQGVPEADQVQHCFGNLAEVREVVADLVARGFVGENDHQRRILALSPAKREASTR